MFNRTVTLYLLSFPVGLMGTVQLLFAVLSLMVFKDHDEVQFFEPAICLLVIAFFCFGTTKRYDVTKISFRDSLVFAVLTWIICGVLGALPIILITKVSFTDGVFESISALTTTGATILHGLDEMPKSFLLYRQFLQWLGGLGVVIFVVAVLPMLNVGGMKLLKAETPGPIKDDKLSPRIASTAHYLWFVYSTLTIMCAIGYYWGGMSAFDAIAHSFTTVSTGGFSTHDASMGFFESPVLFIISDVFMLLGAINFALHFRVGSAKNIYLYWRDEECRIFIILVLVMSICIGAALLSTEMYDDPLIAFNDAAFHLISFMTSTGFAGASFTEWPLAIAFALLFAGYLGGCAGSTAGGNKIIRNILSIKLINQQLQRLIHPKGVVIVKYQGRAVGADVLTATMAFMTIATISTVVLTLILMMTGLDIWTSLTAVAACLNVLGPAFGELGSNFQPVSDIGTWILSIAMILGRLEYFTALALVLPSFWRF